MGSRAVPGLIAKPVADLNVTVPEAAYLSRLERAERTVA
jgi:hypothetical protein